MTSILRGLRHLSAAERVQLAGMVVALPLIHASLRLAGYVRTRRWIERCSRTPSSVEVTREILDSARSTTRLAAIAGRRGALKSTCLRQSLLVYWLLRRRGLDPELKLGVRKQGDAIDAHAWVELSGTPLDAGPLQHKAFPMQEVDSTRGR